MEDYNRLISAKVLDGYEAMLDIVPQPQMLGGKRMRKFVLPGSTEHDYPGTLSVGRMDGMTPATIGGDFFSDFGDGFPTGSLQGGKKFTLKSFGKAVAPVAKELGMTLAKEGIKEGVKSYAKSGAGYCGGAYYIDADGQARSTNKIGNPRRVGGKFNIKSIGKAVAPVAKELGMTLAKEGIKEGVKSYAKGGRRKKGILKSVEKELKSVGKVAAPVAKEVFRDVIVPEGKKALKDYIRESLKARPTSSASSDEMIVGMGRKPRASPRKIMKGADLSAYSPEQLFAAGGALIRDDPSQFHSSVYPPALASYAHDFPMGHDAYGRGLPRYSKSPISKPFTAVKKVTGGARSARGAIVSEIMKKHGLSLPEASKFVKQNGLY